MEKSLYSSLIVNFLFFIDLSAATCPVGLIEVNGDNYKIVANNASCGIGWTEINETNIRPFQPAGTDENGTYSETICVAE